MYVCMYVCMYVYIYIYIYNIACGGEGLHALAFLGCALGDHAGHSTQAVRGKRLTNTPGTAFTNLTDGLGLGRQRI